jgi:hypothetical protein
VRAVRVVPYAATQCETFQYINPEGARVLRNCLQRFNVNDAVTGPAADYISQCTDAVAQSKLIGATQKGFQGFSYRCITRGGRHGCAGGD